MRLKSILLMVSLWALGLNFSYGQGCSDAGFCTLSSFKPNPAESTNTLNNQFKIGIFLGMADYSVSVYGNYIEYNRQLGHKLGLDLKLTTMAQNGNEISTFGLGDAFLNANYKATKKLTLTLGAKIPFSKANKSQNNLPLPMDYQASLGTLDLIFGVGFNTKKLQFVAAVQQPLTQNDNKFVASDYPDSSKLKDFQTTNQFVRSGDVLLRVSYPISITSKFKLTPSVLPIYHLANDKYTDELKAEKEIVGSKGLTLNGNLFLGYEINSKNIIQMNMGMPFVVRDARPDGLTRGFIANLEYVIKF
ncbi:MAG: hypothetical protein IPI59_15100 [Sphingobacteriales bacterium]|jgi:hypothetical protein|nr:hypothetical protein [Sphingobacteriales bacterium]MBP9140593.1 hypothetical protein [Chitinophagales bacterium]MDA0197383.1 hypothetical protein [Bacteroidota bacterium]MBK6888667.1 hypothetical protein [Sphingobacteriales bacterium]MBK7528824.1 hypothetical protein [Sphingobacteriales bacterium]